MQKQSPGSTGNASAPSALMTPPQQSGILSSPSHASSNGAGNSQTAAGEGEVAMQPPEYMIELKDLHDRIMGLQSNIELQQVVELIATTGLYEITSRTFDFDLCRLDRKTVRKLQEFLANSPTVA